MSPRIATNWRVGKLAKVAGVTVRTLHHYESLGLLVPKRAPSSRHRIYDDGDIERLQKIRLLVQLDFSLAEVGRMLSPPNNPRMLDIVRLHRTRLEQQTAELTDVLDRLRGLESILETQGKTPTDEVFGLMERMMNFEKYYSPEQLEELRQRRDALGEDGMRKAQQDWQDLIREVREAQAAGLPPESPEARDLARRWGTLIEAFTGGNPEIRQSLANAYQDQPGAMAQFGIDEATQGWIRKAGQKA